MNSRLGFVLERSTKGTAVISADGTLAYANAAFGALLAFGVPDELPTSLTGRALREFLPSAAAGLLSMIERVRVHGERLADHELVIPRAGAGDLNAPDEPEVHHWLVSAYRSASDPSADVAVIIEDCTALRKREGQARLAQRRSVAGQLAGGIAHDLNNILTAISGFGELAATQVRADVRALGNVDQVLRATQRATALAKQMLAFTRLPALPRALVPNDVMHDVERLLQRLMGESIEVTWELDPALWSAMLDPMYMQQILLNLALSARDGLPDGGHVRIETHNVVIDETFVMQHPSASEGEYVMFSVSASESARVGGRARVGPSAPRLSSGSVEGQALSLETARELAREASAYMTVDREAGRRTLVRVYFPRFTIGEGGDASTLDASSDPLDQCTILLVSNEASVAREIPPLLEPHGVTMIVATSDAGAADAMSSHPQAVDLVIADLDVASEQAYEGARVLFLSSRVQGREVNPVELRARSRRLHKPVAPGDLVREVRQLLTAP